MVGSQTTLTEATYYILLSLYEPLHGYGIMQKAATMSNGRVRLGAGTLYGALNTLVERGWLVEGAQYDRKKEYQITPSGHAAVQAEMMRLAELLKNGQEIAARYFSDVPIVSATMTTHPTAPTSPRPKTSRTDNTTTYPTNYATEGGLL
ncbi:MAG: PadR family transcriptional regulator [Coriobacteriaceae bacterium]|nr:PadR family transcriptional regulator [Coriobacteriaceae bacterium]